MSFTHLHVHSVHSLYHSTLTVKDAVDKAVCLGMNALAITDYDSLYAAHGFVRYSHEVDPSFKPITGCELHVKPVLSVGKSKLPIQKAPHLTVLCKNEGGYKNLCKLLEAAWNEGFHICPTVALEQLAEHKEGLIILSGCPGCEIAKHFIHGNSEAAEEVILKYRELFGEDYYLELIRNGFDEQFESAYSDFLLNMGKKHGIKVVATNDVHRRDKKDGKLMEHLLETNLGAIAKTIPLPTEDWLKSEEEMLVQFPDCLEAISATEEIVAKIETFEVPQWKVPSPRWNEEEYLRDLDDCRKIINEY